MLVVVAAALVHLAPAPRWPLPVPRFGLMASPGPCLRLWNACPGSVAAPLGWEGYIARIRKLASNKLLSSPSLEELARSARPPGHRPPAALAPQHLTGTRSTVGGTQRLVTLALPRQPTCAAAASPG